MFTESIGLPAAPPFDFGPSLRFVRGFPPTSGEQEVGGRALTEARLRERAERYGPWQGYWAHYLRAGA
ncbi:hypothetical protein [Actinomadura bangladeshensis]|uniref:Uncharacterized protein n=1 Tax=Actinomadura bangladeshensis TaxID=453573 RepID=A0A4R4NZ48_9ACTN|nr:hypothetical protein [Actinomadura bangladeshensis]TDC13543.1 hypothetical protein E1284_19820 [Actinomadura bangladeshensis]